jgi:hypothetical protein
MFVSGVYVGGDIKGGSVGDLWWWRREGNHEELKGCEVEMQ